MLCCQPLVWTASVESPPAVASWSCIGTCLWHPHLRDRRKGEKKLKYFSLMVDHGAFKCRHMVLALAGLLDNVLFAEE